MIKQTDKVTFKVAYLKNNKLVVERFNTFAAAAGTASALDCNHLFIYTSNHQKTEIIAIPSHCTRIKALLKKMCLDGRSI